MGYIPAVRTSPRDSGSLTLFFFQFETPVQEKDSDEFIAYRRKVYHQAVEELFKSSENPSHIGVWIKCGDMIPRTLYPGVRIMSLDYEEQYVIFSYTSSTNFVAQRDNFPHARSWMPGPMQCLHGAPFTALRPSSLL